MQPIHKPAVSFLGIMLGAALMALPLTNGCATSQTPKDASLAQKLKADTLAFEQVCHDVEEKCGPNLVSFVKTVNDLLATATNYADLVQDIVHAAALYQDAKMDIASVECVIATVRQDLKALSPKKAAMLDRLLADLDAQPSLEVALADIDAPDDVICIPALHSTAPVCAQDASPLPAHAPELAPVADGVHISGSPLMRWASAAVPVTDAH